MGTTRWGIVSTGYIADRFTQSLKHVAGAQAAAVASRSEARARSFADQFGIPKAYGSYEQIAQDEDIDIVYIGTPNNRHMDDCLMFIEAGKNVLCEKPLAVNEKQARIIIEKAKRAGVFFMEGMWTRFFPAVQQGLEWVQGGSIGQVRAVFANFGIDGGTDADNWRLKAEMAGGAMMDVGIYPLAMAFAVLGSGYSDISTQAYVENGVDHYNTFTLKYPDGRIAVLSSALTVKMENKVVICGTKGCVKIGEGYDWWRANRAERILSGDDPFVWNGQSTVFEQPYPSIGFQYEAAAVQGYLQAGKKQAKEIPWEESIRIAQTIDQLRKCWGVVYDEDK